MSDILRILVAPLAWLASFSAVYGIHGLACALGWPGIGLPGLSLFRVVLLAAWGSSAPLEVEAAPAQVAPDNAAASDSDEGKSDEEIFDFLVQRYGEFALYRPRMEGKTLALWIAPLLLIVVGLVIAVAVVRNRMALPLADGRLPAGPGRRGPLGHLERRRRLRSATQARKLAMNRHSDSTGGR